jgi:CheY-like chemotaxis protein
MQEFVQDGPDGCPEASMIPKTSARRTPAAGPQKVEAVLSCRKSIIREDVAMRTGKMSATNQGAASPVARKGSRTVVWKPGGSSLLVQEKGLRPILLVEDDPITARSVTQMLQAAGFKDITVTELGEEASDLVKLHGPKYYLVLLDLNLPDIHGFEVYRRLGESYPAPIAVVFLTGSDDETDKDTAYRLVSGNIVEMEYITKPFHRTHLVNRVSLFLSSIHDRREKLVMLAGARDSQSIEKIQNELIQIRSAIDRLGGGGMAMSIGHDVIKGAIIGVFAVLSYFGLTSIPFDRIKDFFQP